MKVAVAERRARLREPLRTASGDVTQRRWLELTIEGADGVIGRGEASCLEHYDGVSPKRLRRAVDAHVAVLREAGPLTGSALLDACREADPLPQALTAVDLALWDRAGRREERTVAEMLSDDPLEAVPVNATIGATDGAGAAAAAWQAAVAGYPAVKVKVGVGDDARRVAAVRAAIGPEVALRIDANGAWNPDEAVRMIDALSPAGLELVEEPVHGIPELRAVRERVHVRVAMDETAAVPGAIASGAADAVCLKLSRAGGIGALLAQAALVRATGAEVYLASTLDGPLAIAAAVHCAAALRCSIPCGLATLALFEGFDGPTNGLMPVLGPGLG